MVSALPLDQSQIAPLQTDDGQIALVSKEIARVAEDMIAEHGNAAVGQADQRHKTCELIREVIRDILRESDTKKSSGAKRTPAELIASLHDRAR